MALILRDDGGVPGPQYLKADGSAFEFVRGTSGEMYVRLVTALPAGDNNIGNVDVASLPALPAGSNAIGTVGVTSLPSLPAGTNSIGTVVLGAGTAAVGTVDTELPAAAALADSASNPTTPMIGAGALLYNGSTWDRQRGNAAGTVLASSARTATTNSDDQTNHNGRCLHIVINASAGTGFSVVPKIQAKDPVSGAYYDLLVGAAITATGIVVLKVFPGAVAAANLVANDMIPRTWRVRMEHADTTSVTYSVGYALGV